MDVLEQRVFVLRHERLEPGGAEESNSVHSAARCEKIDAAVFGVGNESALLGHGEGDVADLCNVVWFVVVAEWGVGDGSGFASEENTWREEGGTRKDHEENVRGIKGGNETWVRVSTSACARE